MTQSAKLPNIDLIREWLDYDPQTGLITWKKDRWYNAKQGQQAGSICSTTGYRRIRLGSQKKLQAHRLAWLLHTGSDPYPNEIDHINGNKQDNRISNLRLVTKRKNQLNRKAVNVNNTTGHTGVYACDGKWMAGLSVAGEFRRLGVFDSKDAAIAAWTRANRQRLIAEGLIA